MFQVIHTLWQRISSGPRDHQGLAFLRVATGMFFLYLGREKLINPDFSIQMAHLIKGWVSHHPFPVYQGFLEQGVLPNLDTFAQLVTYGEITIGCSYVLGLLIPLSAPFAILMNLNYLLATQHISPASLGINVAFIIISGALFWGRAGHYYGLDEFLFFRSKTKSQISKSKSKLESKSNQKPVYGKTSKKLQAVKEALEKNQKLSNKTKSRAKPKSKPF